MGNRKMNNKQYTTEEIINRLKAGERITAIDGCNMPNGKDALIIGKSYEVKEYFGGCDFEIESEEYKCHEFDAETFSQFFMFTYDYEVMKSEDVPLKETAPEEFNELSQNHLDSLRLLRHNGLFDKHNSSPQIPEWLQRERVKFWCRCYANLVDKYAHDDCAFRANTDLKQFDKRFLNKDDDGSTTS